VTGGSNNVKSKLITCRRTGTVLVTGHRGGTGIPHATHGTDNQKNGPLALTEGTYTDAAGQKTATNKEIGVTNVYVSLVMWKRMA
jgi:hypothetical protein